LTDRIETISVRSNERTPDAAVVRRKRPHFAERRLGSQSFSQMLEDARDQGLMALKRDARSGGYQIVDA